MKTKFDGIKIRDEVEMTDEMWSVVNKNKAEERRSFEPLMRKYVRESPIEHYPYLCQPVDWEQAALRYAIENRISNDLDDHTYAMREHRDCMKYESDYPQKIAFEVRTSYYDRICRGGDCRGEPYDTYSSMRAFFAAGDIEEFAEYFMRFYKCAFYDNFFFEPYNGFSYKVYTSLDMVVIEESLYNPDGNFKGTGSCFAETGHMIIKEKENGRWHNSFDVEDTTHLFSGQFKSLICKVRREEEGAIEEWSKLTLQQQIDLAYCPSTGCDDDPWQMFIDAAEYTLGE